MKRNSLILLILIFVTSMVSFAQEVTLEVAGNREIEPAYRLSKQPRFIDTIIPYSEINYPLLALKYETTFALDTLKAAKTKLVEKLPELTPGYAKIGIGSKFMPLAEVFYNSVRSRKYLYGAHFKHVSSFGNIPTYAPAQLDRTKLEVFGTRNENKYSIDGNFHFKSLGIHQYGLQKETTPRDSIAQRFTDVGAQFLYTKHKKDSLNLNYTVGIGYNYFQDKSLKVDSLKDWSAKENNLKIDGKAWYKWRKEVINADMSIQYNSYKYGVASKPLSAIDTVMSSSDVLVQLKPNITTYAKNNRLKVKFGVALALNPHTQVSTDKARTKTAVYIYPDIELKYSLFDDILIPYLQINGGLEQQTFKRLSAQNEFLLSNVVLQNENNQLAATLGMKGTLSDRIMFNAKASFVMNKNTALFIHDIEYAGGNQFRVIYDDINRSTFEGSLIYQSSEKIKVEAIGRFNSYLTKTNSYAWNLPQIEVISRAYYQWNAQWSFNLDFSIEGGRIAQVYTKEESDVYENLQYGKKLGFICDVNAAARYQYNEKLSAFLEVNNAAAQRYARWYGYPVMGLQVMGGVCFKF